MVHCQNQIAEPPVQVATALEKLRLAHEALELALFYLGAVGTVSQFAVLEEAISYTVAVYSDLSGEAT